MGVSGSSIAFLRVSLSMFMTMFGDAWGSMRATCLAFAARGVSERNIASASDTVFMKHTSLFSLRCSFRMR